MHIFSNVLFLLIFLINLSVQAFPIPENKKATYDIWRKNKVIGTYEILFFEKDDILNIETNIDIEVKILFITAYKFSHQSKEIWKAGKFIKIEGYSDFEDERKYFIKGEVKDGFLFASGMDGELKLDKNLIPSNYWNNDVMYQNEIFDTQKGIVRKLNVKEIGVEKITINNTEIDCTKFILNATKHPKDKKIFPEYTLWYSKNKELMKFKFRSTTDNKIIEIIRKQ
jgi:hypothetical protein